MMDRVSPRTKRLIRVAASLLPLILIVGCATPSRQLRSARELYYAGEVERAGELLQQALAEADHDRDVLALDFAMTELFSGHPKEAEQTLREIRDQFDYLEQQDIAETTLALVTDDTRRAYAGEDYEKILIRVMLAMANLMHDGADASAYSLQVNAKQQQIVDAGIPLAAENPKQSYRRVATGAYLHGILREATHANYDDVERSFAKVVSWQPSFTAGEHDLQRARQGCHSARGNGVLYVFALVGRGPYKQEASEVPTSTALLLADQIVSAVSEYPLPPTVAPIKVTQVVTWENGVEHVLVNIGGTPAGTTETLTDIGQLAVQQNEAIYAHIVARAVARRAIKKAAVYAAKDQVVGSNPWADLALTAAGVIWEATESADTRCWSLLPDTIQVLRVELPAGQHELTLQAAAGQTPLGPGGQTLVSIEDGRNTYVLACFPDAQPVGQILVSGS
jgi:hypothetical protein